MRRSWRNTKRSCWGGLSWASLGRKVRARLGQIERAQQVDAEEAFLAAHLLRRGPRAVLCPAWPATFPLLLCWRRRGHELEPVSPGWCDAAIKAPSGLGAQGRPGAQLANRREKRRLPGNTREPSLSCDNRPEEAAFSGCPGWLSRHHLGRGDPAHRRERLRRLAAARSAAERRPRGAGAERDPSRLSASPVRGPPRGCRDRRGHRAGVAGRRGGLLPDPLDGAPRPAASASWSASGSRRTTSPRAAQAAGVRRIVYLGGLVPRRQPDGETRPDGAASEPGAPGTWRAASTVERILLEAVPDSVALRASIVIGARSRSFRLLVRLVERLPVLTLPAWQRHRTQPIDERDVIAMLAACAGSPLPGQMLEIGGPDVAQLRRDARPHRRADARRPALAAPWCEPDTPRSACRGGDRRSEDPELVVPLMEGLQGDLLPARRPRRRAPGRAPALLRLRRRARAGRVGAGRIAGRTLMSLVTASIAIDAPPEEVWETVMDPNRLANWVTIHRRLVARRRGHAACRLQDGPAASTCAA